MLDLRVKVEQIEQLSLFFPHFFCQMYKKKKKIQLLLLKKNKRQASFYLQFFTHPITLDGCQVKSIN
jgi:hypothetical protein